MNGWTRIISEAWDEGAWDLDDDLTAIAVWLGAHHPGTSHLLAAERHYSQTGRDLACVVCVFAQGEDRHAQRADAARAMTALGYTIELHQGADVYEAGRSHVGEIS